METLEIRTGELTKFSFKVPENSNILVYNRAMLEAEALVLTTTNKTRISVNAHPNWKVYRGERLHDRTSMIYHKIRNGEPITSDDLQHLECVMNK